MQVSKPKLSHKKLIVSGDMIELYEYEFPYMWNTVGRPPAHTDTPRPRREDNLSRVRQQICRSVEANYKRFGYEPVFLTFTYERNETSVERATKDWREFIARLSYRSGKRYKYLSVIEFQARGAVHFHCIFFNMDLVEENRESCGPAGCMAFKLGHCPHGDFRHLAILWGHGFVDIERIRSAKRVGPYVCKYLNKGLSDPRLIGKKAYFTSFGLLHPSVMHREERIDDFLQECRMDEVHSETYESDHYKSVKYTQYVKRSKSVDLSTEGGNREEDGQRV